MPRHALRGGLAAVLIAALSASLGAEEIRRLPSVGDSTLVHGMSDSCRTTPYYAARTLSEKYPLISVHGGAPPASGPCDPFSAHGYYGKEEATVGAIVDWMLGQTLAVETD